MKTKIFIGLGILLTLIILFAVWYKITYSMEKIRPYEVKKEMAQHKILIATQGSKYKNAIVTGIIDSLNSDPVHIKIMDATDLNEINEKDWDAIIILHTWEMSKPPANVANFLTEYYDPLKFFVISTSGEGSEKIEGIDAITGASIMEEVPEHLKKLKNWLDNTIFMI